MRPLRLTFATLLLLAAGRPADAQTVTGQVVDEATGRPIPAAFVALVDSAGARAAGALSDARGSFRVVAPSPGTYRLRTTVIGYRTAASPPFRLAGGESVHRRLALGLEAIALDGIEATAAGRGCTVRPGEGSGLLHLWEAARGALDVVDWTRRRYLYRYIVALRERILDARNLSVLSVLRDSVYARALAVPFRSAPPDTLDRDGYIRPAAGNPGVYVYSGPDAETILSDVFAARHCFTVREPRAREDAGLVGLAFRPVESRDVADISGVLWLDRATAELRRLDFAYTRMPWDVPLDNVGGRVFFERLASGAWIVSRWWIRMPRTVSGGKLVEIEEEAAEVLHVEGADGHAVAGLARHGAVVGTVHDSTRAGPLEGATVYLSGTGHVAVTDSLGRFRIDGVLEGKYDVAFFHPILHLLGRFPQPVGVEVRPGDPVAASLATPSWAAVLAAGCAPGERKAGTGALVGFVRDAATGIMVTRARVAAAWPRSDGTSGRAEARVDSIGAYRLCAVPVGPPLTVTASFGPRTRSDVVQLDRYGPQQLDFELFLEDKGRLFGRVIDLQTLAPVRGATVRVQGAELTAVTDSAGRFEFDDVPAGVHPVRADHPDYRYTVASVAVPGRTAVEVEIRMGDQPILLDPVTVVAARREASPVLEGFHRRRKRGAGYYITREMLEKSPAKTVYEALESVPGLRVVGAGARGYRLEVPRRPGCPPTIYVDGLPFPMGEDGLAIVNSTPTAEVEGIEVYRGLSEMPAEFAGHAPECGAVIIWTRRGSGGEPDASPPRRIPRQSPTTSESSATFSRPFTPRTTARSPISESCNSAASSVTRSPTIESRIRTPRSRQPAPIVTLGPSTTSSSSTPSATRTGHRTFTPSPPSGLRARPASSIRRFVSISVSGLPQSYHPSTSIVRIFAPWSIMYWNASVR